MDIGFQITAIVILLAFYGCYFTKMILQRNKGIQTNQMGKGKMGFVKRIEVTMKIASFLVPAAELVSIVLNTSCLPLWARITGALTGGCGVLVFILAVVTMRDSWRAGVSEAERTELVTGGIYQISRNPAFLGFDLVYIGMALMFFNWVLLAISVFAGLMFQLQIVNVEEDFLVRSFGKD